MTHTPTPANAAPADDTDTAPRARPASCAELFWSFQKLSLQGFGGVLPVAQRELVERRGWFNRSQFLELLSLSQVLPGPNIINLALIFGDRCFGWRGAIAAMSGLMLGPLALVITLSVLYGGVADNPIAAGALQGVGAVVSGLILATAIKLGTTLRKHPLGLPVSLVYAAMAAVAVAGLRWSLPAAVLSVGGLGMVHVALILRRSKPQ